MTFFSKKNIFIKITKTLGMCTRNICARKRNRAMFPFFCHILHSLNITMFSYNLCSTYSPSHPIFKGHSPFYICLEDSIYVFEKKKQALSKSIFENFFCRSEIVLSHARMWRGHDLRLFISQIVGMLATADRTGTNIPKGIRDPCCQQPHLSKWPRVQSANL